MRISDAHAFGSRTLEPLKDRQVVPRWSAPFGLMNLVALGQIPAPVASKPPVERAPTWKEQVRDLAVAQLAALVSGDLFRLREMAAAVVEAVDAQGSSKPA